MSLLEQVAAEAGRADTKWGTFHSSHEGYGVLAEEVSELQAAIRANDIVAIRQEAIQVSAVAMRIAAACHDPAFRARSVPAGPLDWRDDARESDAVRR